MRDFSRSVPNRRSFLVYFDNIPAWDGEGGETVQEWARAFYKSRAWLETRKAYAASVGWLCEDCLARGLIVPGKVVHHIVPLTPETVGDASVALVWSNLRLVCQDCHASEHRKAKGFRYDVRPDGSIAPPAAN